MEEHEVACPDCGSNRFHGNPSIQLNVQNIPRCNRILHQMKSSFVLKQHKVFSLTLKTYNALCVKNFHLVSAQIGKSFRNEITPGNFTFRTREFEQMELEFFCKPGEDLEWFAYWRNFVKTGYFHLV